MGLFGDSHKHKHKSPLPVSEKPASARSTPTGGHTSSHGTSSHGSRAKDVTIASPVTPKRTPTSANGKGAKRPQRPALERHGTTVQTRYVEMLLSLDRIPRLHNILASFFTWVLLAGYIVFPATFTSLRDSSSLKDHSQDANVVEKKILEEVKNAPLLYVAAVCCGVGCAGCIWLWWKWKQNYVWVINRIFLPAFMNSIAGLISTIVNIYSAQAGQYSVTAKITIIVTAACSVVTAALFLVYNNLALTRVKKKHERETREGSYTAGPRSSLGTSDEENSHHSHRRSSLVEKVKRKVQEPGLEPISVV